MDFKALFSIGTKAAISAIPIVGGSVSSVISDIQNEFTQKRQQEFLEKIKQDMESKISMLEDSTISSEDFASLFCNVYEDIQKTRSSQKRDVLRHLLVNCATSANVDFDTVEKMERLILELPAIELIFLLKLKDKHSKSAEDSVKICKELMTECGLMEPQLLSVIRDLESENLIHALYNQYITFSTPESGGVFETVSGNYLTAAGKELVKYIDF